MRTNLGTGLVTGFLLVAATASADVAIPTFATMDRLDGESKIIPSIGYTMFDSNGDESVAAQNLDLHAHFVAPQGMGGYLQISAARVSLGDETESGLNNLELGGLYQLHSSVPVVFRAGLSIDTSDAEDGAFFGSYWRTTDFMANFPDTTSVRVSASPMIRSGIGFFRADVGVDVPIDAPDDNDVTDPMVRLNVGGGVETGGIAVMGELATIALTGDADERFLHTVAVTGRYMNAQVRPSLSLVVPLDEVIREFMTLSIQVGVEVPLPI
ncbi:MAG: hypothetical protein WKG01_33640 [Kofleriaceae bacterium]